MLKREGMEGQQSDLGFELFNIFAESDSCRNGSSLYRNCDTQWCQQMVYILFKHVCGDLPFLPGDTTIMLLLLLILFLFYIVGLAGQAAPLSLEQRVHFHSLWFLLW